MTTDGAVVYHDGESWNAAPPVAGTVVNVDVGADGIPFLVTQGGGGLYQYEPSSGAWLPPIGLGSITPQQVAVGDAGRVFVLGADGAVSKLENGTFAQVVGLPTTGIAHIAANHDGTLWHSDGSPNAYRFISEQTYGPAALPVASAVQKVASTGYGNALLLASQGGANQLYSYDSPYVFKTSPSFVPVGNGLVIQNPQVTAGGGRCFVNLGSGIVALDSHTGAELWSKSLPNNSECAALVYDPVHRLLYATDGVQTLFALDATTGAEKWNFQVATQPISQPVLSGGGLCLIGGGTVYWLDTSASLAQKAGTVTWSQVLDSTHDFSVGIALMERAIIYIILTETNTGSPNQQFWTLNTDGSSPTLIFSPPALVEGFYAPLLAPGQLTTGEEYKFLFINRGAFIAMFAVDDIDVGNAYPPNGSSSFTPALAYLGAKVYAGDNGALYALDMSQLSFDPASSFQPITLPPLANGGVIGAGPVVAETAAGALIAFGFTSQGGANSVCLYDPATGNLLQLDTDHLLATQLTVDENGILYAAGLDPANPNNPFGQVYAIRIDDILQQERAFIVESELMQDFDEPRPAN